MGYKLNRTEADISKALKSTLDLMEKIGQIVHHDRLNSGLMFGLYDKRGKQRAINMCRPGTPDRFVILNAGTVLWLEVKSKTGTQEKAQKEFQDKLKGVPGHHYMIVRSLMQVIEFIEQNQ